MLIKSPTKKTSIKTAPEFLFANWPAPANIHALTTTRIGGMSVGDYHGFNLADHVDDNIEHVKQNRRLLSQSLNIEEPVWLKQVHGVQVADVATAQHHAEADAIISTVTDRVCAVLTADCLPLLFCNEAGTKVAAAHAGWRGLANGVIENTVDLLQENNKNIMVWLGPAIGPACFEVGRDVYDAFVSDDETASSAFTQTDNKHFLADIYSLARLRLKRLGIEKVYGGGLCTYTDEERFYSFRKNKITGRMASMIWMSSDIKTKEVK